MSVFCTECGTVAEVKSKFCRKCGTQLLGHVNEGVHPSETANPVTSESPNATVSASVIGNWLVVGLVAVIGFTSLQSALSMPSQAEYVTFSFTFDHLMNGGWYIWYSGLPAIAMKLQGSGMDASTLKLILWAIVGFSFSLVWPLLKSSIQKN